MERKTKAFSIFCKSLGSKQIIIIPLFLFQNLRVVYQRLHLPKTIKNDFLEAASKNVKKWILSFCCLTFSFPSLKRERERELEGKGFTKELSHYQEKKKKSSTCKISLRKRYLEKCNKIPLECNKCIR